MTQLRATESDAVASVTLASPARHVGVSDIPKIADLVHAFFVHIVVSIFYCTLLNPYPNLNHPAPHWRSGSLTTYDANVCIQCSIF